MNSKPESPRFILVLGSLFLLAYAAYNLGIAWMDSVPGNSLAPIGLAHTPVPSDLAPAATPTNVPLRWITPTSTNLDIYPDPQTTHNPADALSTPGNGDAYPPPADAYPAPPADAATSVPTIAPTEALPTPTATLGPTAILTNIPTDIPTEIPTSGAYPGPEATPTPTYTPTSDTGNPYPGPGETSTPRPPSTPTATSAAQQPTPTLSQTPMPTSPGTPPTQTAITTLKNTPDTIITTLAYSETQIISNGPVNQAIWLDDETSLALATSNGLYLHDLSTGRSQILDARSPMVSVALIPDDDWIAAGGQDAVIRIWDIDEDSFVTNLTGHLLGVIRLAYSQPADFLASASDDATVRIWDYDGSPLYTFRDPVTRVMDMTISPNGQMVAAASNRHVHIWNPLTGELSRTISQPDGWYTVAAFSPNSQTLTTAFDGRRLEFWDTATWSRADFISLDTDVQSLAYSPDGRMLAIGFEDGRIQIWDALSLFLLADFTGHSSLTSMAFNPSSDQLVTSSADGSIRIWNVAPLLNP